MGTTAMDAADPTYLDERCAVSTRRRLGGTTLCRYVKKAREGCSHDLDFKL